MTDDLLPEEPWEAEITALLGGLGSVEPPEGFLERAIDHRPLFAGRTALGLVLASIVVFGAVAALGAFGEQRLLPDVGRLTAGRAVAGSGTDATVYREAGEIELDSMPGGEQISVDGHPAWYDPKERVIVVDRGDEVVTLVGVDPAAAESIVDDVEAGPSGPTRVVNRLTAGLGFPDLG